MKENLKNPFDYGYLGEEEITITAREFNLIRTALEQGIAATQKINYVEVIVYRDTTTGKEVKNPSQEDIQTGKVKLSMDKAETFNQQNTQVTYDAMLLRPEMLYASEMILDIHIRNVESGIAKTREELEKANELTQIVDTDAKTN